MKYTDLVNENFQVPQQIREEAKKTQGRSRYGRSFKNGSRIGSQISLGRSMRSSKKSLGSRGSLADNISNVGGSQDSAKIVDSGVFMQSEKVSVQSNIEGLDASKFSNDANMTQGSNKVLPPNEKTNFTVNLPKDKTGKVTKQNIYPERVWKKKHTHKLKPIYNNDIDAPRNVFQRVAERELREKRFGTFMAKTGKDMEELAKKDRADFMKKMIK